jgi:3-oxoacyl-[acyl-carrier protein] reductase
VSEFEGRTAIVTGSARGIGTEIARRLHAGGANVVVADLDEEGARRFAAELGERAVGVALDVREEESFETALAGAVARSGRVDILVNNAALTRPTSIWEITREEWDDVYATNARGTFFGCRVFGKHMRENGYGRIVNMASLGGQWGQSPNGLHYATSKSAIIGMTRVFAHQLAGDGVTVNAIAPAVIDGPNVRAVPAEVIDRLLAKIPAGRVGRPDEIAEVVAMLASDRVGYITGATIDVNGGAIMR